MSPERIVHELEPKQPNDVVQVPGIDFAPRLSSGEVVSGITVVINQINWRSPWTIGVDVTAQMLVAASEVVTQNVATFRVKEGLHGRDYSARVRATITPNGRTEDIEVVIPVRERLH